MAPVNSYGGNATSPVAASPSSPISPVNGYGGGNAVSPAAANPTTIPPVNGYGGTSNPSASASSPSEPSSSVAPLNPYAGGSTTTPTTGSGSGSGNIAAGCTAEKPYGFTIKGGSGLTYANSGPDQQSGKLDASTSFCVAGSNTAGLAISVGVTSAHPGNSIIECGVPTNPSKENRPYCDISFVNGYSVSAVCSLSNGAVWQNLRKPKMGYADDLFHTPCPSYDATNKVCTNVRGADTAITSCDHLPGATFFAPADVYGGSEGFWNSANAWPYDPTGMPTVVCEITAMGKSGGTAPPPSGYAKRGGEKRAIGVHGYGRSRNHPRHF